MVYTSNTSYASHWRDSARRPRFFHVDARASLLLLLFILHIRWWTFLLSLSGISFLVVLEYFGVKLEVFLRWFRSKLAGPRKMAIPWWIR